MRTKLLLIICFLAIFTLSEERSNATEPKKKLVKPDIKYFRLSHHNKMRCTRRFTPGVCSDSNAPVWTFDIQTLNCTERLGCLMRSSANRFRDHLTCIKVCGPLINMYLLALGGSLSHRPPDQREGGAPVNLPPDYEEYEMEEQATSHTIEYKDDEGLEELLGRVNVDAFNELA